NNDEIGDICNAQSGTITGGNGTTYTVQKEWSNSLGSCIVTNPNVKPPSGDTTAPTTSVTAPANNATVSGTVALLAGAVTDVVGAVVSPLGGFTLGLVTMQEPSEFDHSFCTV